MYIYFKLNGDVLVALDVNLRDGYLPMVGNVGGDLQFIEPGIWFKTLIIDSVLVDCDLKVLRWTKSIDSPCPLSPEERQSMSAKNQLEVLNLVESLSESSQCMEFDSEVDDLFDSVRNFFENPQILPRGASACKPDIDDQLQSRFHHEILRLVHCYILPSVNLTVDDSQCLKTALQCIDVCFTNAELEILQKDQAISLTESSLRKQRDGFLKDPMFERESYLRECNVDFLKIFLSHLEKDINFTAEQLQKSQSQVDLLRDSKSREDQMMLEEVRKGRDVFHEIVVEMQMMRENIKNIVVRQQTRLSKKTRSRKRSSSVKVFHEIYLEISNRLKTEKENIHKLILRKLKIVSVREAINLASTELETVGHSVGWQSLYDGSASSTDVGILSSKPKEWATNAERVSTIINNLSTDSHRAYQHFCDNLIQKIEGSMDEENFLDQVSVNIVKHPDCIGDNHNEFLNICTGAESADATNKGEDLSTSKLAVPRSGISRGKMKVTEEDAYHPHTLPLYSHMDTIKSEIKKHMEDMCKCIIHTLRQEDLHGLSQTRPIATENKKDLYKSVWLCYESHLYERINVKLNELYEERFRRKSTNLAKKLEGLSLHELGIDEPWLVLVNEPDDWENTTVKTPLSHDEDCVQLGNVGTSGSQKERTKFKSLHDKLGTISIEALYRYADREMEDISVNDLEKDNLHKESKKEKKPQFCGPPSYDAASAMPTADEGFRTPPLYEESVQTSGSSKTSPTQRHHTKLGGNTSFRNGQVPAQTASGGRLDSLSSEESIKRFSRSIDEVIKAGPINMKMKNITKSFKFVATQISNLKLDCSDSGAVYQPCADDMLTVIIIMLTQLDMDRFTKLYAHLNMILDLMPPFMNGSEHDCALMNFHIAFQYLFDRHVLDQSRSCRELDL